MVVISGTSGVCGCYLSSGCFGQRKSAEGGFALALVLDMKRPGPVSLVPGYGQTSLATTIQRVTKSTVSDGGWQQSCWISLTAPCRRLPSSLHPYAPAG